MPLVSQNPRTIRFVSHSLEFQRISIGGSLDLVDVVIDVAAVVVVAVADDVIHNLSLAWNLKISERGKDFQLFSTEIKNSAATIIKSKPRPELIFVLEQKGSGLSLSCLDPLLQWICPFTTDVSS